MTFYHRSIQTHCIAHDRGEGANYRVKPDFISRWTAKTREFAAMKIQRTTRITIEEQKVRTVSFGRARVLTAYCSQCGISGEAFIPEFISELLNVSSEKINAMVEAGRVHVVGTRNGASLICSRSLRQAFDADPDRSWYFKKIRRVKQ